MTNSNQAPGPLRLLRALLAGERALHPRANIVLDVAERQLDRAALIVRQVAAEASQIDSQADIAAAAVHAALQDASTPGVIDAVEARAVVAAILGVGAIAHEHTKTIAQLT